MNDALADEFSVLSGDIFSADAEIFYSTDSDIFYSTDSDIFGADLDLLPASVEADSTDSFASSAGANLELGDGAFQTLFNLYKQN